MTKYLMLIVTLALGLSIIAPDICKAGIGIGIYDYELDVLVKQKEECSPSGPEPDEGCDQCLARSIAPQLPFIQFCGADYDCDIRGTCQVCNGLCGAGLFASDTEQRNVFIAHSPSVIDAAVSGCTQWKYNTHCTSNLDTTPIPGAIRKLLDGSLGTIPGSDWDSYAYLGDDTWFTSYASMMYTLPVTSTNLERGLRQRIGIFSRILYDLNTPTGMSPSPLRETRSSDFDYYMRAFQICWWAYLSGFQPWGMTPMDAGFPSNYPPDEILAQYFEIKYTTCMMGIFDDCGTTGVEASTWARTKAAFRTDAASSQWGRAKSSYEDGSIVRQATPLSFP